MSRKTMICGKCRKRRKCDSARAEFTGVCLACAVAESRTHEMPPQREVRWLTPWRLVAVAAGTRTRRQWERVGTSRRRPDTHGYLYIEGPFIPPRRVR